MREVPGFGVGFHGRLIGRVVTTGSLSSEWTPGVTFFVRSSAGESVEWCERRRAAGLNNIVPIVSDHALLNGYESGIVDELGLLNEGDVVAASSAYRKLKVLYREGDVHHTIFVTNRCNSYCVMCSQPPTRHDDRWLIDEGCLVARHIRKAPQVFGFTGGEPLLAGEGLRRLLNEFLRAHPDSSLEVLTNGRRFSDGDVATVILDGLEPRVSWMVPLYGHADFLHDFVVQSPGAFDETIAGLLTLQDKRQRIQLRVVLVRPVLEDLLSLCEFIGKNLPFVADVALMGCEPIGFARANRELCEVDYQEWQDVIATAVGRLEDSGLKVVLMNIPLCLLPKDLWRLAPKSISDWKCEYDEACKECTVKARCCGLFASYVDGWTPGRLEPILKERVYE